MIEGVIINEAIESMATKTMRKKKAKVTAVKANVAAIYSHTNY